MAHHNINSAGQTVVLQWNSGVEHMMRVVKNATVVATAALLAISMTSGAFAKPVKIIKSPSKIVVVPKGGHGHGHRNRNIGIGLGVAAAAALAAAAAANADDGGRSCRRWDRLCDDGSAWACRKYRNNCE